MRGSGHQFSLEFNGHHFDSVLTYLSDGRNENWSIDLPAVIWILERIATGNVDACTVQDQLRRATLWDSGCCDNCDRALPYHDEARSRYDADVQRWERQQLDPAEYPYILNKGKIHRLGCRYPPKPTLTQLPEDLHAFAGLFDACGDDLDAVFDELDRRSSRGAQRISLDYVLNGIARHGVSAMKVKLCRACKPLFPDLSPSATMLQPACWAWRADSAALDRLRVAATQSPNADVNILPEQRVAFTMLERWHGERCAVCGDLTSRGDLFRDHDHESGMIRGLLCHSCNTVEGRSTSLLFANYRQRSPAIILAVDVLYLPAGFRPGAGHRAMPVRDA